MRPGGAEKAAVRGAKPPTVIECSRPWIQHIADGRKAIEGKKGTDKWRAIERHDIVLFRDNSPAGTPGEPVPDFTAEVLDVRHYAYSPGSGAVGDAWAPLCNFLTAEGHRAVLPGVRDLAEAMRVYQGLWRGEEEVVLEKGVIAIEVEVRRGADARAGPGVASAIQIARGSDSMSRVVEEGETPAIGDIVLGEFGFPFAWVGERLEPLTGSGIGGLVIPFPLLGPFPVNYWDNVLPGSTKVFTSFAPEWPADIAVRLTEGVPAAWNVRPWGRARPYSVEVNHRGTAHRLVFHDTTFAAHAPRTSHTAICLILAGAHPMKASYSPHSGVVQVLFHVASEVSYGDPALSWLPSACRWP